MQALVNINLLQDLSTLVVWWVLLVLYQSLIWAVVTSPHLFQVTGCDCFCNPRCHCNLQVLPERLEVIDQQIQSIFLYICSWCYFVVRIFFLFSLSLSLMIFIYAFRARSGSPENWACRTQSGSENGQVVWLVYEVCI